MDDELSHVKRGISMLVTCVVQTASESDPSFKDRFIKRLERAHDHVRDNPGNTVHEEEMFTWVRTLVTGFSWAEGKGKSFLEE